MTFRALLLESLCFQMKLWQLGHELDTTRKARKEIVNGKGARVSGRRRRRIRTRRAVHCTVAMQERGCDPGDATCVFNDKDND